MPKAKGEMIVECDSCHKSLWVKAAVNGCSCGSFDFTVPVPPEEARLRDKGKWPPVNLSLTRCARGGKDVLSRSYNAQPRSERLVHEDYAGRPKFKHNHQARKAEEPKPVQEVSQISPTVSKVYQAMGIAA